MTLNELRKEAVEYLELIEDRKCAAAVIYEIAATFAPSEIYELLELAKEKPDLAMCPPEINAGDFETAGDLLLWK